MKRKLDIPEMLRGATAVYVAVGHLAPAAFKLHGAASLPFRFGQEAVVAFFFLSGFVIYYSQHQHRDQSFLGYLQRRALRIFPVFLLALLLSWAILAVQGQPAVNWRQLLGNLCLLQDLKFVKPGVWFDTFEGNLPLWSLSYEWWFYLLFFPLHRWVPPRFQLCAAAGISLLGLGSYAAHANQASLFLLYFILWWTGLELARTYTAGIRPTFQTQRASVLVLAGFCALVPLVMLFFTPRMNQFSFGFHPLLEILHFAAALALLCGGLAWSHFRWRGFRPVFGVFSLAAPVSYALYVFHYPVGLAVFHIRWLPGAPVRFVAALLVTAALAWLAEVPLQRALAHCVRCRSGLPGARTSRPVAVTPSL